MNNVFFVSFYAVFVIILSMNFKRCFEEELVLCVHE